MQTAFALTTGCGGNRVFSSHNVTGKCEPDHILAEIKVFEFTITMTAREHASKGVECYINVLKRFRSPQTRPPEIRRSHEQNFSMYVGCPTDTIQIGACKLRPSLLCIFLMHHRVCGRPQIRGGHVTGNCDPDHILAEIKKRCKVFEFTKYN